MIFNLFVLLLAACVLAEAKENANNNNVMRVMRERLAAADAKLASLATASLKNQRKQRKRHQSILGRKRNNIGDVCADGSTVDTDKDGHPDCVDSCPTDFRKTRPGDCGCGVIDSDSDGDGVSDCIDECPLDASKRKAGLCGCGSDDTGCGCNVTPVGVASCAHVIGAPPVVVGDAVEYAVFGRHGDIAARLSIPSGAIELSEGENIVLQLNEVDADEAHHTPRSVSLEISLTNGQTKRTRATNGYTLSKAATVCLPVDSELQVQNLCVGFDDAITEETKCFSSELKFNKVERVACADIPLLTNVRLIKRTRLTSLKPFVTSVSPRTCPADGSCDLRVSGGNFDRGVLLSLRVGENSLAEEDLSACVVSTHYIECKAAPSGRGSLLSVNVEFSDHATEDRVLSAQLENGLSYENAVIHDVTTRNGRLLVRGENFGPVGALHSNALAIDGIPCANARVEEHDVLMSCQPSAVHALEKRHVGMYYDVDAKRGEYRHGKAPRVSVKTHADAEPVHSTPAHHSSNCPANSQMCPGRTCVSAGERCPTCRSGWTHCPLETPVQANGKCHSLRWLQQHRGSVNTFDVTLTSTETRVPIGNNAVLGTRDPPHVYARHCLSFSMPSFEEGFASALYNISAAADWTSSALRLEIRSKKIVAAKDAYGYCLARWVDHSRWQCVDEHLGVGPAPDYFVSGKVMLHKGDNIFAIIHDNCPHMQNPDQNDEDGNGVGDACDGYTNVEDSCRDLTQGNIKYIRKILKKTKEPDNEKIECPSGGGHGVCNLNGKIFNKIHAETAGARRPLPLKAPYLASEKGSRKPFPHRHGIHDSPRSVRFP